MAGRQVAVILTGGNVDSGVFARVLREGEKGRANVAA
jgi:hypothetical protein